MKKKKVKVDWLLSFVQDYMELLSRVGSIVNNFDTILEKIENKENAHFLKIGYQTFYGMLAQNIIAYESDVEEFVAEENKEKHREYFEHLKAHAKNMKEIADKLGESKLN